MARTLSQGLRDRVEAAIDRRLSCRAAAARFRVSVSRAIRWQQLALKHGQALAKPRCQRRSDSRPSGRSKSRPLLMCA